MSTTATLDRIPAVGPKRRLDMTAEIKLTAAGLPYMGRHRSPERATVEDPAVDAGLGIPQATVRARLRPMAAAIFNAMRRRGGNR